MNINVQILDHLARIAITSRFEFKMYYDFKNAFTQLLDNAAVREIEVEMSKVDYMDSAALGMLLLLGERAKAANKPVVLTNASGTVLQVLEIANFSKIFSIKSMA